MPGHARPLAGAVPGVGRACIGLGLVGQGLAIATGIVPHEDRLVAAGLLVFGAVLVATGTLPRWRGLRRAHVSVAGGVLLAAAALAWAVTGRPPMGPLLVLAALGSTLLLAGALHAATLALGRHVHAVRDLVPALAVATGAPLVVWLVQAGFKRATGSTPLETFLVLFLVRPVHWLLGGLGVPSNVSGQTIALSGPAGPLAVEIGVACSGLQAMALFLGILALFAAAQRPSGRQLAMWSLVGLVGVYVVNILRLVTVVMAGHLRGPEALEAVHANAGWAFFVAWSLLFAMWVRRGPPKDARTL